MRGVGVLVEASSVAPGSDSLFHDADGGTELLDGRGVDADLRGDALVGQFHG